ncbi:hypothetical protein H2200_001687 [Cladophialophora chaetospira]|uniref:Uncharacterized protein n=1 Tax=Cladophialophora chaetospira TaxID=386627 RepID=A0AA38XLC4_9EURO|nr:hypothetical protein H2200_001687 [Cladophialophora chaetospira]
MAEERRPTRPMLRPSSRVPRSQTHTSPQVVMDTIETETHEDPKPTFRDASTQTDITYRELTCSLGYIHAEPVNTGKRRREAGEDVEDSASKHHKTSHFHPHFDTFLFSKTRNRSLLTSAPPKLGSRDRESGLYRRVNGPASPELRRYPRGKRASSVERTRPQPQTPTPAPTQGGLFGSVRKVFGWVTGSTQGAAANEGQSQSQSQQNTLNGRDRDLTASFEENYADEGSPSPSPPLRRGAYYEPESPTPEPDTVDPSFFTKENWKRRRFANTRQGRAQLAAMDEANFNPTPTAGSTKRKLASVDGHVPGPKRGGFGIDDSYLDVDNEVEGIGESSLADTEPATPANKRPPPQTPLRSALRQTATNFGANFGTNIPSLGRSGKTVRINSVPTSAKAVYGQYGPAGEYRGSTFADISSQATDSPSDMPWEVKDMHSPNTLRNTRDNTPFRVDPNVRDPHDANWRPTPANPRPGQFVLPDFDDDDDDYEEEDASTVGLDQAQGAVPTQPPSTPRMSHAELPQTSPSTIEQSGLTGHTDTSIVSDAQELRLNKARSEAQKYKPAKSSRLSLSEQARSRSSSPPGEHSEFRESQIEVSTPGTFRPREATTPQDTTMMTASPMGREDLDNIITGEDGMTEYQREHEHDAWASEVFDNVIPQTYVEAGIASSYVDNLLRKTWTARDERESAEFWDREFEEGLQAAREAEEQGRELVWVTDPEEIMELEQNGY